MADQNKAEPKTTEPNPLFRQEALERLSSPERLDELMRVVNLKSWLPLGTIGALLGAGLIWSFVGRIPITTSGRGMLVQRDANTGELVALLHFENSYRGQIRAGMPVVLMPETLRLYNDRGVLAEVEEVVEPPALTLRGCAHHPLRRRDDRSPGNGCSGPGGQQRWSSGGDCPNDP
jgi:hypothetical protein